MKEVYRLEIDEENEGITFDVSPSATVFEMMNFICQHWLDEMREGDGGVRDHLWKISRSENAYPIRDDYQDDEAFDDALHEWLEAEEERHKGIPEDTTLQELDIFNSEDKTLQAMYDFGRSTYFDIHFRAVEKISVDIRLPSLVPTEIDDDFTLYSPPGNTLSLNSIFSNANDMFFKKGKAKWICPFPTSTSVGGFVEGGFNSEADIVFLPAEFSAIHEALVAMDIAIKNFPGEKYTRLAFPLKLDQETEDFYELRSE